MPTYMYKCAECGHRFEAVQGFHDDPLDSCPDCGGPARRVIGNVGVTFKGSGFYRTDSRSDSAKKSSSSSSSAATKSDKSTSETSSSSPSSETSKPAAKESGTAKGSTSTT